MEDPDKPDKIDQIRDRQLNRTIILFAVTGFVALPISLSRAFIVGWPPIMLFQVFLYICIVCLAIFRNRLSFHVRSLAVLSIPLVLGIGGLLTWGLASLGLLSLFTFCMAAAVFYGGRVGVMATAISVAITGAIGGAVHYGILVFDIDLVRGLTSFSFWLSGIVGLVLSAGLIGFALGGIDQQTKKLVETLDEKNRELHEANDRLRQEMAERIHLEKMHHEMGIKLQQSEKMEFLGTLAGGVAHDLNNVLGGITGYTDLLLLKQQHREQPLKYLEAVRDSGKKAAAIVQDFLTLARRGVIVRDVLHLNDIVIDYLKSAEHNRLMMFHPHLKTDIHLEADLMNIIGSPLHISKTVMNLVSNAAEAMPGGGHLVISTRNLVLDEPLSGVDEIHPGEYVTISVEDSGTGIAQEDIQKIFEPFYTKKVMGRSGTGLGMSVVWWTVKDHQGFIDVKSEQGRGTTVTIYLPATRQQASPKEVPLQIEDYLGKGESILVVDDVKDQRELAITLFRELGYQADMVSSGEDAIARLKEKTVDIVFLDMIMDPGIDGLETLRQIFASQPRQKVIITSGFTETERIKEAERLGAVMFLKKPYQLEQMAGLVRRMLQ